MSRLYKIVTIDQGTDEWLAWRRGGIGGSDAAVIMGHDRFKSLDTLAEEKCAMIEDDDGGALAADGHELEPVARRHYVQEVGVDVRPCCLQSTQEDWLRVSLDGLSFDGMRVVEIKCGERNYDRVSQYGEVPPWHYAQLQHALAVTGLAQIDYWCYRPELGGMLLPVERDEEYIGKLLQAEQRFWERVERLRRSVAGGTLDGSAIAAKG